MSVNIFRDSTTSAVGERLSNIQDENVTAESVLLLQTNNKTDVVPISTYGKTLLNSISLAQLKADLDGSPTAVSVNDNGVGEINMTIDGDSNLRLQVKDAETNVYNELKVKPSTGNDYLSVSQSGNQSRLAPSGGGGIKLVTNSQAQGVVNTGILVAGNRTTLDSPELMLTNTSIYCDTGTTIFTKEIRANSGNGQIDIGESSTRFKDIYSITNDSTNYKIADGGSISIGSAQIWRFLDGTSSGLANHYLYQLPANKVSRFTELNSITNFLEFDTAANDINIGVLLNTNNILPNDDSTYDLGSNSYRWQNIFADELRFDGTTAKKIEFFGEGYSTGVQGSTLYFRTGTNFAFYQNGTHSNSTLDPGTGGSKLLTIEGTYMNTNNIRPLSDDDYALGTSLLKYTELHATNGTIQTSDERQKTDISPLHNGLDIINSLKPVTYKWKKNGVRIHLGLIAQDVEQTSLRNTSVFIHDKESDRKGLRYTELIAPLIKAVQELDYKFNKLNTDGVVIKEVHKLEKQDPFCNIKNLLKSMNKEEEEVKPIIDNTELELIKNNMRDLSNNYKDLSNNYNELCCKYETLDLSYNLIVQKCETMDICNNEITSKFNELCEKMDNMKHNNSHINDTDEDSDTSHNILDLIQQRLYELEKQNNKLQNKVKKQTTIINKLVKANE